MTHFRTNTKKYLFENVLISISSLFLFCPSVLAIQKTYRKNASDFFLWRQELQASLEVSSKNFANDGLYWNQFWNLWCAMTKHNFLFLSKFCSFEIHLQTHTSLFLGLHNLFGSDMFICNLDFVFSWCSLIFFYFFSISGCWDRVQGSPWRINYRSTLQNYNGRRKVRLPPTVS